MFCEPYLCLGGVELANSLRTLTYLRRGLGGSAFEVHTANADQGGCETTVVGDVFHEVFEDTWRGALTTVCDPFWPGNLGCYCSAYDGGPYVGPATDDAPWYSPDRPESAEFLGLMLNAVSVRPALARSTQQGVRGGDVGPQAAGGRVVAASGTMYAASKDGMAYGETWLRAVLAGYLLDAYPTLRYLPSCPSDDRLPAWRNLERVGLVDGPVIEPVADGVKACMTQAVSFQMISEEPYAFADPEEIVSGAGLMNGSSYSLLASLGAVPLDAGLRITVAVPSGATSMTNLVVAAHPTVGGVCPSGVTGSVWSWSAPVIPAGHVLRVDGVAEVVEVLNQATGDAIGGLDYLTYTGAFRYPSLRPCEEQCIAVSVTGAPVGTLLSVEQVEREL